MNSSVKQDPWRRRSWMATTGLLVIGLGLGVLWFVSHGGGPLSPVLSAAGLAVYAFGAISGLMAGFLAGLLGIGGSLVVVPALYLLLPAFGVPAADVPHAAIATALAAMLPTALCGVWSKHRQGTLDHRSLMRLAPGTVLGAAAGALFALQLHGPILALAFVAGDRRVARRQLVHRAGRRTGLRGAARRAGRARKHRVLARRAADRRHRDAGRPVRGDGGASHPAAVVPARARCRQLARRRAAAACAVAVTGRGHGGVIGRRPRPQRSGTPAPDPNW